MELTQDLRFETPELGMYFYCAQSSLWSSCCANTSLDLYRKQEGVPEGVAMSVSLS
jgi:hypothetical protein